MRRCTHTLSDGLFRFGISSLNNCYGSIMYMRTRKNLNILCSLEVWWQFSQLRLYNLMNDRRDCSSSCHPSWFNYLLMKLTIYAAEITNTRTYTHIYIHTHVTSRFNYLFMCCERHGFIVKRIQRYDKVYQRILLLNYHRFEAVYNLLYKSSTINHIVL